MPAEIIKEEGRKSSHFFLFVSLLFIVVLAFLFYTSFYDTGFSPLLTGSVIDSSQKDPSYEVKAELSLPEKLFIDSSIQKVGFKIKEPIDILVGNEIVHLNSDSSFIVGNFSGTFVLTSQNISQFAGKAQQVFVNGVLISQKSGQSITVSTESDFSYTYVTLSEIYLDEISYPASGTLLIQKGKIVITLDKELFILKNFEGDIELSKNYFRLTGKFDDFDVSDFMSESVQNSS